MNPLALLGMLSPKAWGAIGLAALVAFAGTQTWRIERLKGDVRAAVAAQRNPVTRALWKDEARAARAQHARSFVAWVQCSSNGITLDAARIDQNQRVAALGAESTRRTQEATQAVQRAEAGRVAAERAAAALRHPLAGSTACERAADADRLVLESLR